MKVSLGYTATVESRTKSCAQETTWSFQSLKGALKKDKITPYMMAKLRQLANVNVTRQCAGSVAGDGLQLHGSG